MTTFWQAFQVTAGILGACIIYGVTVTVIMYIIDRIGSSYWYHKTFNDK